MFIKRGATHKLFYRLFIIILASTQIYVSLLKPIGMKLQHCCDKDKKAKLKKAQVQGDASKLSSSLCCT